MPEGTKPAHKGFGTDHDLDGTAEMQACIYTLKHY